MNGRFGDVGPETKAVVAYSREDKGLSVNGDLGKDPVLVWVNSHHITIRDILLTLGKSS